MPATVQSSLYPEFDEDGLLHDPAQWNAALAQTIAHREGVGELGEAHWKVIHSLRQHFARFGAAPAMIQICRRLIGALLGPASTASGW